MLKWEDPKPVVRGTRTERRLSSWGCSVSLESEWSLETPSRSTLPSALGLLNGAWLLQWNTRRNFWPTLVCGQPLEEPETRLSSSDSVDLIGIWSLLADSWFLRSPSPPCLLYSGQADLLGRLRTNLGLSRIEWGQPCGLDMKPLKDRRYQDELFLFQRKHRLMSSPPRFKRPLYKPSGVKHSIQFPVFQEAIIWTQRLCIFWSLFVVVWMNCYVAWSLLWLDPSLNKQLNLKNTFFFLVFKK